MDGCMHVRVARGTWHLSGACESLSLVGVEGRDAMSHERLRHRRVEARHLGKRHPMPILRR